MTDQNLEAELRAKALPIPSRTELLKSAVEFFRGHLDQQFKLFHGIENMSEEQLRALPIEGTTLEPIEMALKNAGVPTDGTLGNLLDLGAVTKIDVHVLTCDCHIGTPSIEGAGAGLVFLGRLQRQE